MNVLNQEFANDGFGVDFRENDTMGSQYIVFHNK